MPMGERVASGEYGNTSEYLRELIRRDRQEQAVNRLRALVADGLESGAPCPHRRAGRAPASEGPRVRGVKAAALRPLAEADLVERSHHDRTAGGADLAERFFDAAIAAVRAIESSPGLGSARVGEVTGLDGLRRIGIEGFPCGWLYLERPKHLDVIRLLADRQDLATAIGDTEDDA